MTAVTIFRCSASCNGEILVEKMNLEDRVTVTRAIINMLDSWGVSAANQVALLALPKGTRPGAIRQFRQGTPFPEDAGVMERIEHLVGIADALRARRSNSAACSACSACRAIVRTIQPW